MPKREAPRCKSGAFTPCLLQFKSFHQITEFRENWQPKDIQKHPKSSPLPPLGSIFAILGPSRKRQFIHEFWGPQKAIKNPKKAAAGCPGGPKRRMEDPPPISGVAPPRSLLILETRTRARYARARSHDPHFFMEYLIQIPYY